MNLYILNKAFISDRFVAETLIECMEGSTAVITGASIAAQQTKLSLAVLISHIGGIVGVLAALLLTRLPT